MYSNQGKKVGISPLLSSQISMSMYSIKDIAEYIVALIAAFARRFSMTETEAYQYLHRYGAISVAHEYYDVMHTQSFNDMVESMASYCRRKGGQL